VLIDLEALVQHKRGGGGGWRWDTEQFKNGLYTHLKLMRWRRASIRGIASAVSAQPE
jgi:hypothetical protein